MDNLKKDLELMIVEYDKKAVILSYVDKDNALIYEVKFNLQKWDNGEYVDDEVREKEQRERIKKYYGVEFEELESKIGDVRDIYAYDNFNSLEPVEIIEKFEIEDEGVIINTTIEEVVDNGNKIMIKFKDDNGKMRVSNMQYSEWNEDMEMYFVNVTRRNQQYAKFKDKFGVPIEERDSIKGKPIVVEVKIAFGKFPYAEIKKPRW